MVGKKTINSSEGVIRALQYLSKHLDLAKLDLASSILYLTIIQDHSKGFINAVPLPYWYYGLPDYESYLRFFSRFNLIYKMGQSALISEELVTIPQDYSIGDLQTVNALDELSKEIAEINSYFTAT
jgi:hypothetical protein